VTGDVEADGVDGIVGWHRTEWLGAFAHGVSWIVGLAFG